ncbi:HU family DNA-binding protein [Candidatus Mycoplasma haematohominis]|uniref:HU family DNA-binding protein n=1 Tax=Candidatus Mycoplasma haematohominis TaxID=1494318 RepID=UPI001C0A73FC|nr:HU family DNA-binding protein [Candidatus Mycoplasma haemohominis]
MTKGELVPKIADRSGHTQKEVQQILKHFQIAILEELKASKEVKILELGQFKIVDRSERTGVNPQDPSKKLVIPATKVPKLSPSRKFKDFVAGDGNAEDFTY